MGVFHFWGPSVTLARLKATTNLAEVAKLLGFTPKGLSFVLYTMPKNALYSTFDIPKKDGGTRTISAPTPQLKLLQKRLAQVLSLCVGEIEHAHPVRKVVSHGFQEGRSIVTNAANHRRRRYVLNLDIADFFGTINFGRVRGYFISDASFKLDPAVATILAQIACHKNSLPQGSPSSPIVSNLIGAILDRRLISLAKENKCTYTRYADDLTFSSRLLKFPRALAYPSASKPNSWRLGKKLREEIKHAGFKINKKKTRMQIAGSRQMATGLVVNEKVNVTQEYYRDTRSMCHSLFRTGKYHRPGSVDMIDDLVPLQARLAHVYYVRTRRDRADPINKEARVLQTSQPYPLYLRFLLYKHCVANTQPTLVAEGRSDITYLSTAIKALAPEFPALATVKAGKTLPTVQFLRHSEMNRRILNLTNGTGGIASFINVYKHQMKPHAHWPMSQPVIIVVDNDAGADVVFTAAKKAFHVSIDFKTPDPFFHLGSNLYLVKTPVGNSAKGDSSIEHLFPPAVLAHKIDGKPFDPDKLHGDATAYGKVVFADKVVRPAVAKIDFSAFKPLLAGIKGAIKDYAAKHAATGAAPGKAVEAVGA